MKRLRVATAICGVVLAPCVPASGQDISQANISKAWLDLGVPVQTDLHHYLGETKSKWKNYLDGFQTRSEKNSVTDLDVEIFNHYINIINADPEFTRTLLIDAYYFFPLFKLSKLADSCLKLKQSPDQFIKLGAILILSKLGYQDVAFDALSLLNNGDPLVANLAGKALQQLGYKLPPR